MNALPERAMNNAAATHCADEIKTIRRFVGRHNPA
jgi:hypothetical protein